MKKKKYQQKVSHSIGTITKVFTTTGLHRGKEIEERNKIFYQRVVVSTFCYKDEI